MGEAEQEESTQFLSLDTKEISNSEMSCSCRAKSQEGYTLRIFPQRDISNNYAEGADTYIQRVL